MQRYPRPPQHCGDDLYSFKCIFVEARDELSVEKLPNEMAVSHARLLAHESPGRQLITYSRYKYPEETVASLNVVVANNRGCFWFSSLSRDTTPFPSLRSSVHRHFLQYSFIEALDELAVEELVNERVVSHCLSPRLRFPNGKLITRSHEKHSERAAISVDTIGTQQPRPFLVFSRATLPASPMRTE